MSKKVKIKFIKSPTAIFRLAYFIGDVVEMNANQAEMLIEAEYAEEYAPALQQKHDLPVDIPGRDKLTDAGVTSLEELLMYDDYTEIKGIGKKTAEAITVYLKR